jgi:hypothetical protein
MGSFKFIIKVGYDFKIRLAGNTIDILIWFVKVALQNLIQNMKLRVNTQLTVVLNTWLGYNC